MEEKYCERCGAFLGLVNPCKKYCEECKAIVRRERQALIKKGIKPEPEPALCAWCKKPMIRKVWSQKYHPECAKSIWRVQNYLGCAGTGTCETSKARTSKVYRTPDERCRKAIRHELRPLQYFTCTGKGEGS